MGPPALQKLSGGEGSEEGSAGNKQLFDQLTDDSFKLMDVGRQVQWGLPWRSPESPFDWSGERRLLQPGRIAAGNPGVLCP